MKSWKDWIQSACKSSNATECRISRSLSLPLSLYLSLSRPSSRKSEMDPQSRWITYTLARFYSATGNQRTTDIPRNFLSPTTSSPCPVNFQRSCRVSIDHPDATNNLFPKSFGQPCDTVRVSCVCNSYS